MVDLVDDGRVSLPSTYKAFLASLRAQGGFPKPGDTETHSTPHGDYELRYDQKDMGERKPRHVITAHDADGKQVGFLNWYGTTGTIDRVDVEPEHSRRGLATAMWNWGQTMRPRPKHSAHRTDMGDAWSKSVGGPRPRRVLGAARPEYGPKPAYDPEAGYEANRDARDSWEASMRHGLAHGHLTNEQAMEHGYTGSGHDQDNMGRLNWKPLPKTLYHATTDLDAVHSSGALKTRKELGQTFGHGLGGGDDGTISFTDDKGVADSIHHSILELHRHLNDPDAIAKMHESAKRGEGADHPFDKMVRSVEYGGDGSNHTPAFRSHLRGMEHKRDLSTQEEMDAKGEGWRPHPDGDTIKSPHGDLHTDWERPATEEERHRRIGSFYKAYAGSRQFAGGKTDPLFFQTDFHALAKKDPKNFGVVTAHPKPGAQGYQLGALGEWRSPTGSNVTIEPRSKTAGRSEDIDALGRSEHPNVQDYISGGIGHKDDSRSVVGFLPTSLVRKYREHDTTSWRPDSAANVAGIRKSLESGEGLHEPARMEYDHDRGWGYLGEGNHRVEAAHQAGIKTVPVIVHGRSSVGRQQKQGIGGPMHLTHDFSDQAGPGYVPPLIHPHHFTYAERDQTKQAKHSGNISVAGIALMARDTGRVLMIQRSNRDKKDPARGAWEAPGGHLDEGEDPLEGAKREFAEETGVQVPSFARVEGNWVSGGIYMGFALSIGRERSLDINLDHDDRGPLNPDDPDGDDIEVCAWWLPSQLPRNPAVREEFRKGTDFDLLGRFEAAKVAASARLGEAWPGGAGSGMAMRGMGSAVDEAADQSRLSRHAVLAGLDDDDYRMSHRPPGRDGTPIHDMTHNFPADVYTHPHYYSDMSEPSNQTAHSVIRRVRGNPEAKVKIYRALPAEHAHQGFRPGDWVTTSKDYARQHGQHATDPKHDWPVISTTVPAKHLHTDGDDFREFGYNGDDVKQGSVAYKGGYHQEVSQKADGTVSQVQRKAPSPIKGFTVTHEHGSYDDMMAGRGGVSVHDRDGNYAGHMRWDSDGVFSHNIEPQHADIAEHLDKKMRSFAPPQHRTAAVEHVLDQWQPTERLFAPTKESLDPTLFDEQRVMRPNVREAILGVVEGCLKRHGWGDGLGWTRVYLAGSQASLWWGNHDFDLLLGVDFESARAVVPAFVGKSDQEIADLMNQVFWDDLDDEHWHPSFDPQTEWHLTCFVNVRGWDIRDLHPYAAYSVTEEDWTVEPVSEPEGHQFGATEYYYFEGVAAQIRSALALPEPQRTQRCSQIWSFVHTDRSRAFGPHGTGAFDRGNALEKYLDQASSPYPGVSLMAALTQVRFGNQTTGTLDHEGGRHGAGARGRQGLDHAEGGRRGPASGRGEDSSGPTQPGADEGRAQAQPLTITWHPKAIKDLRGLDKRDQNQILKTVDGLANRHPDALAQTHPLKGTMRGWSSTKASRGHRIVHQMHGDDTLHVGWVGLHEYDQAERRLSSLLPATYAEFCATL